MIIKKKVLFCVLFLYLSTLVASISLRGEEQTTILQDLTRSKNLITSSKSKIIGLENSLNSSLVKIINLKQSLVNYEEKLNLLESELKQTQNQLQSSNQKLVKVEMTVKQSESNLKKQNDLLEEASRDYKRLQAENTLIKIGAGVLIIGAFLGGYALSGGF